MYKKTLYIICVVTFIGTVGSDAQSRDMLCSDLMIECQRRNCDIFKRFTPYTFTEVMEEFCRFGRCELAVEMVQTRDLCLSQ